MIGALYTWNLTASGYANSFYSAAVQAGSQSWKAFFFGSLDSANAITVDKPPASLWPMALSVRLFGLNSFAILFPQVLMARRHGGCAVRVRAAPVQRHGRAPHDGGLRADARRRADVPLQQPGRASRAPHGRAVYCTQRAMEKAETKWLVWAGTAIGFAFLVKTLQAFLILPVLALVYVIFAPTSVRRRIGQVLAAGLAMVVAGGWWVAIVELWPASSRPYIGGSQNNSFLELTFGYNGLGRINGEETGSVGGGGGGGGTGHVGRDRLGPDVQLRQRRPDLLADPGRADPARRGDLGRPQGQAHGRAPAPGSSLWGGSLLITMVIFSYMQGIFHDYYTVALAPYIAPLVGMGAAQLWQERDRMWASLTLAAATTATAVWGYVLLNRSSDYLPWLKWLVLVGGLTAALGLVFVNRLGRQLALAVVGLSFVTALAGPTAYTLTTLNEGHTGSIVTAGPAVSGGRGGFGGGGGGMRWRSWWRHHQAASQGQQNGNGNTRRGQPAGRRHGPAPDRRQRRRIPRRRQQHPGQPAAGQREHAAGWPRRPDRPDRRGRRHGRRRWRGRSAQRRQRQQRGQGPAGEERE